MAKSWWKWFRRWNLRFLVLLKCFNECGSLETLIHSFEAGILYLRLPDYHKYSCPWRLRTNFTSTLKSSSIFSMGLSLLWSLWFILTYSFSIFHLIAFIILSFPCLYVLSSHTNYIHRHTHTCVDVCGRVYPHIYSNENTEVLELFPLHLLWWN